MNKEKYQRRVGDECWYVIYQPFNIHIATITTIELKPIQGYTYEIYKLRDDRDSTNYNIWKFGREIFKTKEEAKENLLDYIKGL